MLLGVLTKRKHILHYITYGNIIFIKVTYRDKMVVEKMCRSVHDFVVSEVDFLAYAQQKGFVKPNDPQKN